MGFRASINNMVRTDRPESPTDAAFLFGFMWLLALQTYVTLSTGKGVPDMGLWVGLLTALKTVKVGKDYVQNKWGGSDAGKTA